MVNTTQNYIEREEIELELPWLSNFDDNEAKLIGGALRNPEYMGDLEGKVRARLPEFRVKPAIMQHLAEDQTDHFDKENRGIYNRHYRIGSVFDNPPLTESLGRVTYDLMEKAGEACAELDSANLRYSDPIWAVNREEYLEGKIPSHPIFIGLNDFAQWKEFFAKCLERRADYIENGPYPNTPDVWVFGHTPKDSALKHFSWYIQKPCIQYSKDMGREYLVYRFAMATSDSSWHPIPGEFKESFSNEIFEEAVKVAPIIGREAELASILKSRGWPSVGDKVKVTVHSYIPDYKRLPQENKFEYRSYFLREK